MLRASFRRAAQVVVLGGVTLSLLGAGTPDKRFDKVGHKLMCTCGCSEILLECNHVGCPNSTGLIADLHQQVDSGASESAILAFFAAANGPTVLAAPLRGTLFDNAAWVIPFAVLVFGVLGVVLLVRLWKKRNERFAREAPAAALPTDAETALRERIRAETRYGE